MIHSSQQLQPNLLSLPRSALCNRENQKKILLFNLYNPQGSDTASASYLASFAAGFVRLAN
jgi:hypothetical protein